jgi:hypothetical protein
MTKPSPLKLFGYSSIDYLVGEGIQMLRCAKINGEEMEGEWDPNINLIRIDIRLGRNRKKEDLVIIHEWLHAYEDLVLKKSPRFREFQIDWWSQFHYKKDPKMGLYIRSFYKAEGF